MNIVKIISVFRWKQCGLLCLLFTVISAHHVTVKQSITRAIFQSLLSTLERLPLDAFYKHSTFCSCIARDEFGVPRQRIERSQQRQDTIYRCEELLHQTFHTISTCSQIGTLFYSSVLKQLHISIYLLQRAAYEKRPSTPYDSFTSTSLGELL